MEDPGEGPRNCWTLGASWVLSTECAQTQRSNIMRVRVPAVPLGHPLTLFTSYMNTIPGFLVHGDGESSYLGESMAFISLGHPRLRSQRSARLHSLRFGRLPISSTFAAATDACNYIPLSPRAP